MKRLIFIYGLDNYLETQKRIRNSLGYNNGHKFTLFPILTLNCQTSINGMFC